MCLDIAITSARGGSCMPTTPRNVKPCSSARLACRSASQIESHIRHWLHVFLANLAAVTRDDIAITMAFATIPMAFAALPHTHLDP